MKVKSCFLTRYGETDQMGIVHHSNYARWFEIGRFDFFRSMGISNKETEERGILLPLYEMNCKYISPARAEDSITVMTSLNECTRVRVKFSYQIFNTHNKKILASGQTMHAWTDKNLQPINVQKKAPDIYKICNSVIEL